MELGTPVQWGKFLLFSRSAGHKTKETYPARPGSPTPCKQGLKLGFHMIATIAVITAIGDKNGSATGAIDGFHMNEDRGDLGLTTQLAPFLKFRMAAVNRRQRTHIQDLNRISLRLLSSR